MNEVLKEYGQKPKSSFRQILKLVGVSAGVIIFGIYVGNMLFGKRSLDVMLGLQEQRDKIASDVEILKKYNAELQKTYFELKELEP